MCRPSIIAIETNVGDTGLRITSPWATLSSYFVCLTVKYSWNWKRYREDGQGIHRKSRVKKGWACIHIRREIAKLTLLGRKGALKGTGLRFLRLGQVKWQLERAPNQNSGSEWPQILGEGEQRREGKKKLGWGRRRVLKILIWIWISMSDGVHIHIWILYPISNENQAVLLYSGPWHKNESSLQRISGEYIWNKGKEVLLCATCGQRGEFAAIEDHRVKKCS